MEVTTRQFKNCDLVAAAGSIDSNTASQLAEAFESITEAGRCKIVFDMNDVEFASSAALRVLISVQKACKRWGRGELVLARVPQRVYEALDLVGFVPLFKFYDDDVEAVGSF